MRRALALGLALVVGACAQGEPDASGPDAAREWLVRMRAAHARADAALARDQRAIASEVLRAALELPTPAALDGHHRRIVQQDLWFRLSGVELASAPSEALLAAERGLAHGHGDDLFTSNLLVARGRALAALGRDTEAASSYHEALAIDERLLQAALPQDEGADP